MLASTTRRVAGSPTTNAQYNLAGDGEFVDGAESDGRPNSACNAQAKLIQHLGIYLLLPRKRTCTNMRESR